MSKFTHDPGEYWPIPHDDRIQYHTAFMKQGKGQVFDDLIEWWNVSRRHKHGRSAVWSVRAFKMSMHRVLEAPTPEAARLVLAGVEHGWQALKPDYLKPITSVQPWKM